MDFKLLVSTLRQAIRLGTVGSLLKNLEHLSTLDVFGNRHYKHKMGELSLQIIVLFCLSAPVILIDFAPLILFLLIFLFP